jgi:hypothetical protein
MKQGRGEAQLENRISKPPTIGKDSKLLKMLNNQGREEAKTRVARASMLAISLLMWFNPPIGRI